MSPHHWPRLLTTCWVFTLCVVRNKSESCSTVQSWAFLAPEWVVQVLTWSPRTSRANCLQPQHENDRSTRVGMLTPTQVAKKVCQRLTDQVSPWRCGPIVPRKTRGWYHKILFGTSSSWYSRTSISVHNTLSSTVGTMRCCEWRWSCSKRIWTTPPSLTSLTKSSVSPRKSHQILSLTKSSVHMT